MAKPIKETPILTGRDAVNFFEKMKIDERKNIDKVDVEKMKKSSDRINKLIP